MSGGSSQSESYRIPEPSRINTVDVRILHERNRSNPIFTLSSTSTDSNNSQPQKLSSPPTCSTFPPTGPALNRHPYRQLNVLLAVQAVPPYNILYTRYTGAQFFRSCWDRAPPEFTGIQQEPGASKQHETRRARSTSRQPPYQAGRPRVSRARSLSWSLRASVLCSTTFSYKHQMVSAVRRSP